MLLGKSLWGGNNSDCIDESVCVNRNRGFVVVVEKINLILGT